MKRKALVVVIALGALLQPAIAWAHCDALDGPVVRAARAALDARDVKKVLPWVQPADETEIRAAFDRAIQVRALGPDARALADTWFFETLVRIHRAGEGAPFDGLKPAGQIEPIIARADQAIDKGTVDVLAGDVAGDVRKGIADRFARVMETRQHAGDSVEAGRAHVAAYVEFVHYVEGVHGAAIGSTDKHETPTAAQPHRDGGPR